MNEKVLILDFGSQYTQLIARRVREAKVYCEILPFHTPWETLRDYHPSALILSGGPNSVYAEGAPRPDPRWTELKVPVLGICYGLQLMGFQLGGKIGPSRRREFGFAKLEIVGKSPLLEGIEESSQVWMSHGDELLQLPPGFERIASTENAVNTVVEDRKRRFYGVQFHPEVVHTPCGKTLLSNFLFRAAGLKPSWNMSSFVESSTAALKERLGKEKVLLGLSGGVDSSVAALLLHRAIGDRLVPVFVDTGLLRKNEGSQLQEAFHKLGIRVYSVKAGKLFLERLKGVSSPERKRKIIGKAFIDVFTREAKAHGKIRFLAQGTLYPDVIESVSVRGPSAVIKSHHNVGGLPKTLNMELVEPLRELFKDEVREMGRILGLDPLFLSRHPFPGPGLAVRIPGTVTPSRVKLLQEADAILTDALREEGLYNQVWQAFAFLLPVKTVGVMGDCRTYENVCALRMVTSQDGMTAAWFPAPYDFLQRVATRIVNEVRGINRIVYDITSKPPGTIEWE